MVFSSQAINERRLIGPALLLLTLAFARPLYELLLISLHSSLYSHIVLIPFVSSYLIWLKRSQFAAGIPSRHPLALVFAVTGVGLLVAFWTSGLTGWTIGDRGGLVLLTLAFLCLLWATCAFLLTRTTLRAIVFPLGFLVFITPMPLCVEHGLETLLQHASAEAAFLMFNLVGTPLQRSGLVFQLPDITLEVAPECSGIHSSVVLFITAVLAGHLFFQKLWTKSALALFVIPLGILRNGFRVFTLGELCVYVDPGIIDSPLHHHGGPVFFVMSLVPLFLLIWWLRKADRPTPITNGHAA